MLNYTISLCHVREIHISSYETRCKARSYLKQIWNTGSWSHTGFTGLMRERLSEELMRLLPLLSEHSPEGTRSPLLLLLLLATSSEVKMEKSSTFQVQRISAED